MGLQAADCSCVFGTPENGAEFPVEMIVHFRELKNVGNPGVWLFTKFLICLEN
jgi:hypothetical protein